jgi:hypothetical protein
MEQKTTSVALGDILHAVVTKKEELASQAGDHMLNSFAVLICIYNKPR